MRRLLLAGLLLFLGCSGAGCSADALATSLTGTPISFDLEGYYPFRAPTTPSALDDEFDNGSFAAKWLPFHTASGGGTACVGGDITVTESAGQELVRFAVPNETTCVQGFYQAIPTPGGSWTAVTRIIFSPRWTITGTNPLLAAIAVFQDAAGAPDTSDIVAWGTRHGVAADSSGFRRQRYDDYTNVNVTNQADEFRTDGDIGQACVRLVRDQPANQYYFDYSADCVDFPDDLFLVPPFQPNEIGLIVNNSVGSTANVYFDFFRFKDSVDRGPIGRW